MRSWSSPLPKLRAVRWTTMCGGARERCNYLEKRLSKFAVCKRMSQPVLRSGYSENGMPTGIRLRALTACKPMPSPLPTEK
ncbi:hypothetical protein D3C71_1649690 [compost metagenome]